MLIKLGTVTLTSLASQALSPSLTLSHLFPSTISVSQLYNDGLKVYSSGFHAAQHAIMSKRTLRQMYLAKQYGSLTKKM